MTGQGRGANTVALPDMRRGEVAISIATVLARCQSARIDQHRFQEPGARSRDGPGPARLLRHPGIAGQLRQLRTWRDVESHLRQWNDPTLLIARWATSSAWRAPIRSSLPPMSVSGGSGVFGPPASRTSASSSYAHGTGTPGGLTPRGPDLLRAMREAGMALDVTHLADDAFWQALEIFDGPIWASHNNCRALVPGDRQFSDDQLRALIERDAVIGAVLDIWMLYPTSWPGLRRTTVVSLEDVVDHIDHICQLAGNTRHVAVGSDLDGEFGTEQTPHDVDTIADLQKLPAILAVAWLHEVGHRRDHARQLAPHLQARAAGVTTMEKVRFGLIGTGTWGNVHAETYSTHHRASLAAVCDLDEARARNDRGPVGRPTDLYRLQRDAARSGYRRCRRRYAGLRPSRAYRRRGARGQAHHRGKTAGHHACRTSTRSPKP